MLLKVLNTMVKQLTLLGYSSKNSTVTLAFMMLDCHNNIYLDVKRGSASCVYLISWYAMDNFMNAFMATIDNLRLETKNAVPEGTALLFNNYR